MRVAVSGHRGQVVQALQAKAADAGVEVVAFGRPEADLEKPDSVAAAIASLKPDAVVNAAAYTAVDQAESDPDTAMRINCDGAAAVARAAAALGVPVIHLSTDYVFDGRLDRPYREEDATAPLGAYGHSKLAGEKAVAGVSANSVILRTSWVYSSFGRNFVRTMLSLATQKAKLRIVNDNFGAPTNAFDLADGILKVTRNLVSRPSASKLRGVFHLTNAGAASSAEFASEIFDLSSKDGGPSARIIPVPSSDYPTPARRPANSRLDNAKIAALHGVVLPEWRQSLSGLMTRFVRDMQQERS